MTAAENSDRITNRVPKPIARKLQEAAELIGATVNQFMVQASLEKAEKILDREKTIYFSKKDAAMLIDLLDNPPLPNAALLKASEQFRQREIDNSNQSGPAGSRTRREITR